MPRSVNARPAGRLARHLAGALVAGGLGLGLLGIAACGGARKQAVQPNDRASCQVDIEVDGVPCAENCSLVEQALSNVDGVEGVRMDFATKLASVDAVHPACGGEGFDAMIAALEDAGFGGSIASTR